jgi:hypothetical protein
VPDIGRAAKAADIEAFAQQAGVLLHDVQFCAVSTDNPRQSVLFQGNTYPISGNAYSVPLQGPIFYDVTLLNEADGIDEFGSTFILAHELGHQVQFDNPSLAALPGTQQFELQADCLEGIYLGHLYAIGQLTDKDVNGIAKAICSTGVLKNFDWADTSSHGTCEQRTRSAYAGGYAEYLWETQNKQYDLLEVCSGIVPQ